MLNNITKLLLTLSLAFAIPAKADDTKHLDNTVAAGALFKLSYVIKHQGSWSEPRSYNPKVFKKAMEAITKDLSNLSATERGEKLKTEGEQLVSFFTKAIVLVSEPMDQELDKFLRDLGIDPDKDDPSKLTEIFTKRMDVYAKLSSTPAWVYDPTKREKAE